MLLRLLDLIHADAGNEAIEEAVKRDTLLSLNLLRLVNSHLTGTGAGHVESVSEALARLGWEARGRPRLRFERGLRRRARLGPEIALAGEPLVGRLAPEDHRGSISP